ncbi:hypothetical protein TNIN_13081, partial [Trichonephila inaurata madagascariensis]
ACAKVHNLTKALNLLSVMSPIWTSSDVDLRHILDSPQAPDDLVVWTVNDE